LEGVVSLGPAAIVTEDAVAGTLITVVSQLRT